MQAPATQVWVNPQPTHALPWVPQAIEVLPPRHVPSVEQQPAHEATEHFGGAEPHANPTTEPTASAATNQNTFVIGISLGLERPTLFVHGA